MTDSTYEQTNYFCLAVKHPGDSEFSIEGSVIYKDSIELQERVKRMADWTDGLEKKIFHFKLVGEVE